MITDSYLEEAEENSLDSLFDGCGSGDIPSEGESLNLAVERFCESTSLDEVGEYLKLLTVDCDCLAC